MSQSKQKLKRRVVFLSEHKRCCFCGGSRDATTWDHVPPRACFPRGYHPENHEFPACLDCNQGTRHADQIFAFYSHTIDHDEKNHSSETTQRLLRGIRNNYPSALPKMDLPTRVKRSSMKAMGVGKPLGMAYSDVPLVGVPKIFGEAALATMRKLACALYYKEINKPMPSGQQIIGGWHQIQNPLSTSLTKYFNEHMAVYRHPTRSTIKNYGDRFVYKFAYNDNEDFFGYAAQFGLGLLVWGIAARPDLDMSDSIAAVWRVGESWDINLTEVLSRTQNSSA